MDDELETQTQCEQTDRFDQRHSVSTSVVTRGQRIWGIDCDPSDRRVSHWPARPTGWTREIPRVFVSSHFIDFSVLYRLYNSLNP